MEWIFFCRCLLVILWLSFQFAYFYLQEIFLLCLFFAMILKFQWHYNNKEQIMNATSVKVTGLGFMASNNQFLQVNYHLHTPCTHPQKVYHRPY